MRRSTGMSGTTKPAGAVCICIRAGRARIAASATGATTAGENWPANGTSPRPGSVQARRQLGHWEIDTVIGKGSQHCIVSLVERKTGYVLIGKLESRTVEQLNGAPLPIARRHADQFSPIPADNGSEFHGYALIEQALELKFYFATPHHSWERGTNENTNGLIRQYIPKGVDMDTLTQHDCNVIATKLNTRPRKRLDYRTPEECFYAH